MLKYDSNESPKSSHFFIRTQKESLYILTFNKKDAEDQDFRDEFLQENVVEMQIAKVTLQNEAFCKGLAITTKHIFENILFKHDDKIVFLTVPENSLKQKLIDRFIESDDNNEIHFLRFVIDGYILYFFINEEKTSLIPVFAALLTYFKEEYGIDFTTQKI